MNDDRLIQLLKDESYKPSKNEWFTPRLLNKLPARQHSTAWVSTVASVLAVLVCIAGWVFLVRNSNFMVITVRDIVYFTALVAVTVVTAWQVLKGLVLADE